MTDREDDDDDMIVQCEACDAKHHMDETVVTVDGCNLCPSCFQQWKEGVASCDHEWTPEHDQYGDPGQTCLKCGVLILDEDMAEFLAGRIVS